MFAALDLDLRIDRTLLGRRSQSGIREPLRQCGMGRSFFRCTDRNVDVPTNRKDCPFVERVYLCFDTGEQWLWWRAYPYNR